MQHAAKSDADLSEFIVRAKDWGPTWLEELKAAGDDLWARGCGW